MAKGGRPERREPRFGRDYDEEERTERRSRAASGSKRRRRRGRSLSGHLIRLGFVFGLWGVVAIGGVVAYEASQLPPIDQLAVPKRPPNIAIMDDEGKLLANRGDTGGAAVHIAELPPYLPKAFVAIEDRRFYSHFGIDPIGISRAIVSNVVLRRSTQGGSTLTQQLAKNLFLTQERTVARKIQEAILAIWLEHKYSKNQILEMYLNRVYFGAGAFGVEAAAHKYFNTDARKVTVPQAAMLAGLMKAPTKLAPNKNYPAAVERAAQVVTAMKDEAFISEGQAKLALSDPAKVIRPPGAGSINYAADFVVDMLDDVIGSVDQDIVVQTTVDRDLQAQGESALDDELAKKGAKYGVSQGALVALDPDGSIRVLIGGRDYAESQFDRAVAAKRQPGSAFKPFVYLTALEKGMTPDSVVDDSPISVGGWHPDNMHAYEGPVSLTRALSQSLNSVAVRLCVQAGPKNVVATAHRLGVGSELQNNASIALGTSEVTPLELVSAYVPFANGGIGIQPHIITRIKTSDGKLLYQRKSASTGRVIDPHVVAMMNTMMTETLISGTAKRGGVPGWQAAGKTGTTQDYRDAWFVGYTSRLVTGVWLGNDDSSPTKKVSGGSLPVEVWSRFMRQAMANETPTPLPYGTAHGAPDVASAPAAPGLPSSIFGIPLPSLGRDTAPREPGPIAAAPPRPRNSDDQGPRMSSRSAPEDMRPPGDLGDGAARPRTGGHDKSLLEKLFGTAL